MTVLTHARNRHRRWLAWLGGLAVLILPVSLLTTTAASAARQSQPSASTSAHCSPAYLASKISLPRVTVDSAVFDTSGRRPGEHGFIRPAIPGPRRAAPSARLRLTRWPLW